MVFFGGLFWWSFLVVFFGGGLGLADFKIIKKSEINCAKNLLMPDFYTKTNLNFSGKNNASLIQKRNFLQKKKEITKKNSI